MPDLEQQLQAATQQCGCADEAIWTLAQAQVGQVLLIRAVANVFNLTLTDARQAVRDAVARQGIPPLELNRPQGPSWPDREAGVLATLAQGPLLGRWQDQPLAVYQACFLPSWDLPLMITVERSATPLLTAVATEPFSGPDAQGRVQVPRWPVPVRVDTELMSWSVRANLAEEALLILQETAAALVPAIRAEQLGYGLDGTTILGSITTGGQVTPFRTWSPQAEQEPAHHAFLSALIDVTLTGVPQGQVHQAVQAMARELMAHSR
ncbi:hypothetical protein LAJ19_20435 (plasmid) [Deinococcus taeanensis]|uniref:hypothetical protein n=1 Tax=Deinococcus taeanensis TaxID=2737050 RepID=UPI001CDD0348|nr:hypothetical protein [Deinococcus taeanensis]UBV45180.1 hypothetical protein LAJ19_20435 [Deinococcus taeanensis]